MRQTIEVAVFLLLCLVAALAVHAWMSSRNEQQRLASTLAAQKQVLASASASENSRDAALNAALAQIEKLKRDTQTPAQIVRDLPAYLPLPQPITLVQRPAAITLSSSAETTEARKGAGVSKRKGTAASKIAPAPCKTTAVPSRSSRQHKFIGARVAGGVKRKLRRLTGGKSSSSAGCDPRPVYTDAIDPSADPSSLQPDGAHGSGVANSARRSRVAKSAARSGGDFSASGATPASSPDASSLLNKRNKGSQQGTCSPQPATGALPDQTCGIAQRNGIASNHPPVTADLSESSPSSSSLLNKVNTVSRGLTPNLLTAADAYSPSPPGSTPKPEPACKTT